MLKTSNPAVNTDAPPKSQRSADYLERLAAAMQEHIGSMIVHVLDFISGQAYTVVTPEQGGFMRLTGRIEVKSTT